MGCETTLRQANSGGTTSTGLAGECFEGSRAG